jgi:hypothetical protein
LDRDSHVKKQDFFQVVNAISRNPSGRHLAWYFYRHYYADLFLLYVFSNRFEKRFSNCFILFVYRFGLEDFDFGQSIKVISETYADKFFLEEVFFLYRIKSGNFNRNFYFFLVV